MEELKADVRALGVTISSGLKGIHEEMRRDHMPRREIEAEFRSRDDRIAAADKRLDEVELSNKEEFERMRVWFRWLVGLAATSSMSLLGICVGIWLALH